MSPLREETLVAESGGEDGAQTKLLRWKHWRRQPLPGVILHNFRQDWLVDQNIQGKAAQNLQSHVEPISLVRGCEKNERDLEAPPSRRQDEHRSHSSLLHTMCSVDADLATTMLARLRRGIYDEALGLKRSATPPKHADITGYPWERES
jgi:aminoglycoside phosphotransferase